MRVLILVSLIGLSFGQSPVLLSSIQALTLKAGHQTTSRRGPPVPQISCTGGNCDEGSKHVQVMQCNNKGLDSYGMPQWECKAEVPSGWRLGTTDVSCEGFANSDDPYILAGSCGVEYTIHGPPTPPPKRHQPPPPRQEQYHQPSPPPPKQEETFSWTKFFEGLAVLSFIFGFTLLIIFICCMCSIIESRAPVHPARIIPSPVYPPAVYPTPVYPVVATSSSMGDFAAGYVVGSSSSSQRQQPYYSPPTRRRRSPSPVHQQEKVVSTGYGTTKRR